MKFGINSNKLIIDNLTFHSISKFLVQATAAFSTGKILPLQASEKLKLPESQSQPCTLIVRRPAECSLTANFLATLSSFRAVLTVQLGEAVDVNVCRRFCHGFTSIFFHT